MQINWIHSYMQHKEKETKGYKQRNLLYLYPLSQHDLYALIKNPNMQFTVLSNILSFCQGKEKEIEAILLLLLLLLFVFFIANYLPYFSNVRLNALLSFKYIYGFPENKINIVVGSNCSLLSKMWTKGPNTRGSDPTPNRKILICLPYFIILVKTPPSVYISLRGYTSSPPTRANHFCLWLIPLKFRLGFC